MWACICEGCKFQSLPVAKHKAANLSFLRFSPSVKSIHRIKIHLGQTFSVLAPNPTLTKKSKAAPPLPPAVRSRPANLLYN